MTKKKVLITMISGLLVLSLAAPIVHGEETETERRDILYSCACGPECDCNAVSTEPGQCACGKDLEAGHVVKIEGDEALVCTCGADCTCELDDEDPTKCGCGKTIKRVNLAGTGIYFCNCDSSCTCNTVSKEPGDCKCGMKLKKVDA